VFTFTVVLGSDIYIARCTEILHNHTDYTYYLQPCIVTGVTISVSDGLRVRLVLGISVSVSIILRARYYRLVRYFYTPYSVIF